MVWKEGKINGVEVKAVVKHSDNRGWLVEVFRCDEVPENILPKMGYISVTHPGVSRGPHEHRKQTDIFGFIGPGNFRLTLWDNRKESSSYGVMQKIEVGDKNPVVVTVPPGIVHGYTNISSVDAMVLNFPDSLYAGKGKKEPVDEIRYEGAKNSPFILNG